MNVLYVDHRGQVHSGWLTTDSSGVDAETPRLVSRAGKTLGPGDVLALLAPGPPREDRRAALLQAAAAGYRVEES